MHSSQQVRRIKATSVFLVLSLALLLLSAVGSSASAQCVASFREIKFADGSARVKNYVCNTEGAAKPDIRVEFDRLSEAAAGNLIQGELYPELDKAFGKVRLVNNAVAVEAKKLFDQFGVKSLEETCYAFQVASAAGGKGYESNADNNCGKRAMWFITFPDREDLTTLNFPLPADVAYYQANSDWPHGYSFFYKGGEYCEGDTSLIYCTLIWRPANAADIANYDANLAAYDKALGLDDYTPEQAEQDVESGESADVADETDASTDIWASAPKRYFSLVNYLTRDGFPADFLFISGAASECGGGVDFSIHIRQMVLDVAFIQNISSKPVSIDGLLGSEATANNLRAAATAGASGPLALASGEIKPGETVAVPLAISFVMADSLKNEFENSAEAAKTYKRIQSAPSVIELKDDTVDPPVVVKKARDSFGPPTAPKPATYFYGPEIALKGLVVGGKQIVFDQASRNFMQLTAGEGYGSCPYLYSWDDGDKAWVRHGKVIDDANSKDKEMTETKTFPGFRGKFRLAEEELEVSYIDRVKLEVELKDGGGMTLKPNFAATAEQDARYATIKAGDRIEFSFALPPTVKADDVKQSTLAVTGFYRRYSDLLMAKQ
jgi:hypothetical protein